MASARRLRDACERGDLEVVNDEIARGVDVNDVIGASWSALHRAAERGRVQIVRALVRAGADVNAETKTGGTTAIQLAADKGYGEVVRELLRHGASAPSTAIGSPSASPIYSVSYARPTTTPRAHPATTIGTRDIVRRLDEERFARNIDKLQSPTAESPRRTVAPRPSPRADNPYKSSPRAHADRLSGSTMSPRAVPSNEEMRERLYRTAENGRGAPASPAVQYSPLSTAPRVSGAVTPRLQRNPDAERITAELAASYRSISSSAGSPTAGQNGGGASSSLDALRALKLHVDNVVDHAISCPELQSRDSAKISAAVHLEEIAESLLKTASSLRPGSFLYMPKSGGAATVTAPEEAEKSKQTSGASFSPATHQIRPLETTRTAAVAAPEATEMIAAAPTSAIMSPAAPALSLQPEDVEVGTLAFGRAAAEQAAAEQAVAEKAVAEKAAAEKAAAEKAAADQQAAAERAAAEKAAADRAAAEKAEQDRIAFEKAKLAEEKAKLAAAREAAEKEREAAEETGEDEAAKKPAEEDSDQAIPVAATNSAGAGEKKAGGGPPSLPGKSAGGGPPPLGKKAGGGPPSLPGKSAGGGPPPLGKKAGGGPPSLPGKSAGGGPPSLAGVAAAKTLATKKGGGPPPLGQKKAGGPPSLPAKKAGGGPPPLGQKKAGPPSLPAKKAGPPSLPGK